MNSLEWVNAEIVKWQEILENFKEQLIRVKGTRNEQTTLNHIEASELKLQYLQQIKTKLEAWEVIKKHFEYHEGDVFNCFKEGFVQTTKLNNKDFEIIKKALEVKEDE